MKICLVAPRVGKVRGVFIGGSANNVVNLSKELAKRHEVHLVTSPPIGTSEVEGIDWCQVHQIYPKGSASGLRYGFEFLLKAIYTIKKLHETENFEVMNSHSGTPKLGLISGLAGEICKVPSIHTLYTPITPPSEIDKKQHAMFSNYRLFSGPFFSKLQLSKLDCIIAISNNVEKSISRVFNKKIEVIPPCIDTSRFNSPNLNTFNLKNKFELDDKMTITFLGDEREARGLRILIKAIKEVRKKVDVRVIIVAGREKEKVRGKIKGIEDLVVLLDIVDMPSVLAISDIFVAPILSTFDIADIPLSILEAMAAGKPVIASNIGGIPEIIEHQKNGILVEPGDSEALADAIVSLLENKDEKERIGRNARIHAKQYFSTKRVAEEYEKVYEEILKVYNRAKRG